MYKDILFTQDQVLTISIKYKRAWKYNHALNISYKIQSLTQLSFQVSHPFCNPFF